MQTSASTELLPDAKSGKFELTADDRRDESVRPIHISYSEYQKKSGKARLARLGRGAATRRRGDRLANRRQRIRANFWRGLENFTLLADFHFRQHLVNGGAADAEDFRGSRFVAAHGFQHTQYVPLLHFFERQEGLIRG